jgi:trimeric autotransporter adhesin
LKCKHSNSISAYGIWHNGNKQYTICGGLIDISGGIEKNVAYVVDWDQRNKKTYNWSLYAFGNDSIKSVITHFDGISTDGECGYNLTGDYLSIDNPSLQAFFANIKRNKYCEFRKKARWERIKFPTSFESITSGNSVYQDIVIGVYTLPDGRVNGYISK